MPQQLPPAPSTPPVSRQRKVCPGAPRKKRPSNPSCYRSGDDWLLQHFDKVENKGKGNASSPVVEASSWLQPQRRLFPEDDDHERGDQRMIVEPQQSPPSRRLFFAEDDAQERWQGAPRELPGQLRPQPRQRQTALIAESRDNHHNYWASYNCQWNHN
jgi:hypothetical protein